MNAHMKLTLSVLLWVGPIMLGIIIAMWAAETPTAQHVARLEGRPIPRAISNEERELEQQDHERIQGVWEAISLERDGQLISIGEEAKKTRVIFRSDTVTFDDCDVTLRGRFRLDPTTTPKSFDLIMNEDGIRTIYPAGIYRLDATFFQLCFAYPSKTRPTRFTTTPESGSTLFVYRRAAQGPDGVKLDRRRSLPVHWTQTILNRLLDSHSLLATQVSSYLAPWRRQRSEGLNP